MNIIHIPYLGFHACLYSFLNPFLPRQNNYLTHPTELQYTQNGRVFSPTVRLWDLASFYLQKPHGGATQLLGNFDVGSAPVFETHLVLNTSRTAASGAVVNGVELICHNAYES